MKRRDFLTRTGGLACALIPGVSLATPCPPTMLGGSGGSLCAPADAEADWLQRISGPGVVWCHDFRSAAEVDSFRWAGGHGNDPHDVARPGQCIHNTSDGITGGGCLELIYPIGSRSAPGWWRPLAPMNGTSNGRGADDPAAGGTIELAPWNPENRSENEKFRRAYYAHPSYIGADGFSPDQFNGSEFWLQFRIKIDANRYHDGTPAGGKLSFLATTQQTLNQEIVKENRRTRLARWYTNFGSSPDTGSSLGNHPYYQVGGDYDQCENSSSCWHYEPDKWVTMLYHLVPGTHKNKDTLFEVFVARQGQTEYEVLFSQNNTINFSPINYGHPYGWNSFQPSNYMNNQETSVQWYQRYDQIIFSHDFIPCPQY
jgi:hypothetical protein